MEVEVAVLGSPSLTVLMVSVKVSDLRSCVKVEVAVLGFPSLIVLMVSVKVLDVRSCVKVEVDHNF